jgi:hypothetical protein
MIKGVIGDKLILYNRGLGNNGENNSENNYIAEPLETGLYGRVLASGVSGVIGPIIASRSLTGLLGAFSAFWGYFLSFWWAGHSRENASSKSTPRGVLNTL